MSRVAKHPIPIPPSVEVNISGQMIVIKGVKGTLSQRIHDLVGVTRQDNTLTVSARNNSKLANMLAGTSRALLSNMVKGVTQGFERKLEITGVGYRAQVQTKVLNLNLGFSRPVNFPIPEGIDIETPTPTEIIIKGIDKQRVGQIAAEIRAHRPPEPYKGKGIRFSNEVIMCKEAKKT